MIGLVIMNRKSKPLSEKRIGVFGKGGSGKTTLAILLAKALLSENYQVVFIDADSTNTGISRLLGFEKSPKPLLDFFGGMVFSGGKVTCPVDDPKMLEDSNISIRSLPPDYFSQNNGMTLFIAGKIGNKGPGAGCDGPIAKIARDFNIHFEDQLPVTILDFKAGFEDSARGVITNLDWAIVVVDPTIASIEMASDMENMVARIKAGELPATEHLESKDLVSAANQLFNKARIKGVLTVMNKVENRDIENYLSSELLKVGVEPISTIPFDQLVSESCLRGKPLDSSICKTELEEIIKKLESLERFQEQVRNE